MDKKTEQLTNDKIDRFINYEMSPEEEAEFMAHLDKDKILKEKVLLRQLIVEAERKNSEEALLAHIKKRTKHSLWTAKWRFAACACVLLAGLFFYGRMYSYSPQNILADSYTSPVWEGSRDEGFVSPMASRINNQIAQWYEEGKEDSLTLYYQKLDTEKELPVITLKSKLFLGIVFLHQGKTGLALSFAKELQGTSCEDAGEWLQLGCLLYQGNRQEALELTLRIHKKQNRYSEDARKIHENLNQRKWF